MRRKRRMAALLGVVSIAAPGGVALRARVPFFHQRAMTPSTTLYGNAVPSSVTIELLGASH